MPRYVSGSIKTRLRYALARANPTEWIPRAIVAVLVMSWPRRLVCAGGAAVALWAVGHLYGTMSLGLWMSPSRLPVNLTERAPLFTEAWLAADQAKMLRFVRPADEPAFRQWLAATAVPPKIAALRPRDRRIKTDSFEKDDQDGAIVAVSVAPRAAAGDASETGGFVQRQMWTYADGNWCFIPQPPPDASAEQTVATRATVVKAPLFSVAGTGSGVSGSGAVARAANAADDDSPNSDNEPPVHTHRSGNVVVPPSVPPWQRGR